MNATENKQTAQSAPLIPSIPSAPSASFASNTALDAAAIADTVREPLLVLDRDLRVAAANRAFYAAFPAEPDDLLNRPLQEIPVWGEITALRRLLTEVLPAANPVRDFEIAHPFPRLGPRILMLNARILEPEGLILIAIEDVTEIRDGLAYLRESELRYRLMAREVVDYAIFSLDPGGHIVTWSEGAYRMKGYTEEEILGQHFRVLYPSEDREREKPEWEMSVVVRDGRFKDFGWRRKKDGSLFWAEVVITAMRDEGGTLIGFGKVVKDLTESKRITEERERLRELELISESSERQQHFLRDVLYSVTNRKLHLCASPADLPPRATPCGDAVPVSDHSMARLRRQALRCAQAEGFETERQQDLVTAVGEAAMNAVVHGGGGVGTVCVVRRDSGPKTLQVWVEDQGQGMTLEQLPRATLDKGHSTIGTLGHGFFLMLQTVDRVWLLTGKTGTMVVLEQDESAPVIGF